MYRWCSVKVKADLNQGYTVHTDYSGATGCVLWVDRERKIICVLIDRDGAAVKFKESDVHRI